DPPGRILEGPLLAEHVPVVSDAGHLGHAAPATPRPDQGVRSRAPLGGHALRPGGHAEVSPALARCHRVQLPEGYCPLQTLILDPYSINLTCICVAETVGLCDVHPVEMLQDQAQCILGDYVRHKYPRQPTRFGRLLLLIPCLRAVSPQAVEKLFFKDTIGDIPIERLIGDMYHMERLE
ncbi:nuclear receptor subfamily 2 group E member 1, partial [Trichonephila clavata]